MFQPYELFIGLRYMRSRQSNSFVSIISLFSALGIAIGVAALITVLSVMNGFQMELRQRILTMTSHLAVLSLGGAYSDWRRVVEEAERHPEVVGAAPYIDGQVMISSGRRVSGSGVKGIFPEEEGAISQLAGRIQHGSGEALKAGEFNIILGSGLAKTLGVGVGGSVNLLAPEVRASAVGVLPRFKRFRVAGIFHAGMYEYDRLLSFAHADDVAKLLRFGDRVSGVRVETDDVFAAPRIARELQGRLPGYSVDDWTKRHASFFAALRTEKIVMAVILTLIIAVAAFNIITTMVMVVTEKRPSIAILRTFGATPRSILQIFFVQGFAIGCIGTLLGLAAGTALALHVEGLALWVEQAFGWRLFDPKIYHVSTLPSRLSWTDVAVVAGVSFAMAILATLPPARRASQLRPAEVLRYE